MTKRSTFILSCLFVILISHSQPVFPNAQIHAEVERALLTKTRQDWPDATVSVSVRIDPRLHLSACSDLEIVPRGQQQIGRVHVAVRCGKPQAWSVYLPVDVAVSTRMLVASRPLVRGQPLNASDVEEALMPISGRGAAMVTRESIRGLTPKRPVAKGTQLTLALFSRAPDIARNDVVRLLSGTGSIRIETKGKAMRGGQIGDQVMVENLNSGRRVAAWIIGPGTVSTRPRESL